MVKEPILKSSGYILFLFRACHEMYYKQTNPCRNCSIGNIEYREFVPGIYPQFNKIPDLTLKSDPVNQISHCTAYNKRKRKPGKNTLYKYFLKVIEDKPEKTKTNDKKKRYTDSRIQIRKHTESSAFVHNIGNTKNLSNYRNGFV